MKKLAISTINATSIPNFSSLQEADWIPSAGINISPYPKGRTVPGPRVRPSGRTRPRELGNKQVQMYAVNCDMSHHQCRSRPPC